MDRRLQVREQNPDADALGLGQLAKWLERFSPIVAVVMPLGFETTGTYFAAEYRAKGEGRLLRGFMTRAYSWQR